MGHLTYSALLVGCLLVTAPLELLLRVRVYARWRRLLLALVPGFLVFVAWVLYAIAAGHWHYSDTRTLGVRLPGGIPVEEVLFFLVVPVCAVLALEAVRKVTGWDAGYPALDDSPGSIAAGPEPSGSEDRSERRRSRSGAAAEATPGEPAADRGAESGRSGREADR